MTPPRRFVLANVWHDDNKGDTAIVIGTIRLLRHRWPGCEVAVAPLCADAAAVRHLRHLEPDVEILPPLCPELPQSGRHLHLATAAWALRLLWTTARVLAQPRGNAVRRTSGDGDVVLVGGSNLFDTGSGHGLSTLRLLQLLLPAVAAIRAGATCLVLGHTLGPFRPRKGAALAGAVLRRVDLVLVRESLSQRCAYDLGVTSRRATDLALQVRPHRSARVESVLADAGVGASPFVALTVRRRPYGRDALDEELHRELVVAMTVMLRAQPELRFLVVAQVLGPTAVEDDREPARALVAAARRTIGADRVVLVDADLAPDELAALYGAAAVVIGERFHSALLAMAAGTPAYAISYFTAKAAGVMTDLGLERFHTDLDGLDGQEVGARALELSSPASRARVARAVAVARRELEEALS